MRATKSTKAPAPTAPPEELRPFIDAMAELIAKQALASVQQTRQRRSAAGRRKVTK